MPFVRYSSDCHFLTLTHIVIPALPADNEALATGAAVVKMKHDLSRESIPFRFVTLRHEDTILVFGAILLYIVAHSINHNTIATIKGVI